jgi:methionyl aminopeptidase
VHGDTNATFLVGEVDAESQRLLDVTRQCLYLGVEAVAPGRPISDIGRAIELHASRHGCGVVRLFGGHGIGERFHTDLHIPHYFEPRADLSMAPGMVFTIEPMITLGTHELEIWADNWTAVTADGSRAAQFEHTIVVTRGRPLVLTP